jgi:hypothetical protein
MNWVNENLYMELNFLREPRVININAPLYDKGLYTCLY